ncbi:hypothetical protein JTB14_027327 [Gonioctena quinquepunctata]|nr:hypothetical protein JTB14_027327 [Gonioctena quinquepunctata]
MFVPIKTRNNYEKKELYKTVGISPESKILCKAGHSLTLLNIINHKTIFGLESVYDGDKSKTSDTNEDSRPMTNIQSEHSCTKPNSSGITMSYYVYFKITYDLEESYSVRFETSTNKRVTKPQLVGEYASLAKIKQEVFEAEKMYKERKQEREEILFKLKKNKLELDIKIRL